MIITVDRSIQARYLAGHEVVYPELEVGGPREFDLKDIVLYRYSDQYVPSPTEYLTGKPKEGLASFTGHKMLAHLKESNRIYFCMGLRDAEEISKIPSRDLPKKWQDGIFTFWRSVTKDKKGTLWVPQLRTDRKKIKRTWLFLDIPWYKVYSTPLFPASH